MACCIKYLSCLLLSLAAGFATYAAGAIAWCILDPEGAGAKLLFTIPIAVGGMTIPGIIGMLCVAFRCDWITEPKPAKQPARAMATPATPRPTRTPRPRHATAPVAQHVDEDVELAFAT